ncbi:MAG: HAD family phosphatase [Salibacteraceae bacterium]
MKWNKIDAIIFDLGGVILRIDYNRTVEAFQSLGFSNFKEQYSQMKQSGLFDQLERGELSENDFVAAIKHEIPNRSHDEIIKAWNAIILDFPEGRIEYIQGLRKQLPCFLLSNTNDIHLNNFNAILKRTHSYSKIEECFDRAYLSHEIAARKPEPKAWNIILNNHELEAQRTLFIDDSPQHIEAANKLGLQTIHLTNIDNLEQELAAFLA